MSHDAASEFLEIFDRVRLLTAIPERDERTWDGEALGAGQEGCIVEVHGNPPEAFEVEFLDEDGFTIDLATLRYADLAIVAKYAEWSARPDAQDDYLPNIPHWSPVVAALEAIVDARVPRGPRDLDDARKLALVTPPRSCERGAAVELLRRLAHGVAYERRAEGVTSGDVMAEFGLDDQGIPEERRFPVLSVDRIRAIARCYNPTPDDCLRAKAIAGRLTLSPKEQEEVRRRLKFLSSASMATFFESGDPIVAVWHLCPRDLADKRVREIHGIYGAPDISDRDLDRAEKIASSAPDGPERGKALALIEAIRRRLSAEAWLRSEIAGGGGTDGQGTTSPARAL